MIKQSQVAEIKRKSKIISATVIAVILAVVIFASTAFAGMLTDYSVVVIDNGVKTEVNTNQTQAVDVLKDAGITVSGNDKLDISAFNAGEGGQIVINRPDSININVGGTVSTYNVYANTVGDAFNEIGYVLNDNDQISCALTDSVKDGMVIEIKTAFAVAVDADGVTTNYAVSGGTVADVLAMAQITLGAEDYTEPATDAAATAGTTIKVYRVTYGADTKTEAVKHETVKTKDSSLASGKTKVKTEGVDGEVSVVYNVKYINGVEAERTEQSRTVTKEAVTEVKLVGTKKTAAKKATAKTASKSTSSKEKAKETTVKSNGVKSKNGYKVGQKISGRYTHYCACATCNGNSRGITSSGKKIYNGMQNPYYVACNWLPLGSVINVDGTNYTVVDRGGSGLSAKGRIDIFTPEGHAACYKKGAGSCSITIERLGW